MTKSSMEALMCGAGFKLMPGEKVALEVAPPLGLDLHFDLAPGELPKITATLDCALDLQTGRCTLEATTHCWQACPYQAMLHDGTAPASDGEVLG